MLTLSERKALHERNSGLGHIGKQIPRIYSSPGATVSAPPRAAGLHDGGVSSVDRDANDDSRFGALTGARYWLPAVVLFWVAVIWAWRMFA